MQSSVMVGILPRFGSWRFLSSAAIRDGLRNGWGSVRYR